MDIKKSASVSLPGETLVKTDARSSSSASSRKKKCPLLGGARGGSIIKLYINQFLV